MTVAADTARPLLQWEPHDIAFTATTAHPWWGSPVRAEFSHEASGARLRVGGFWDGERRWVVRFAAPLAGRWTYRTESVDRGLGGKEGGFEVVPPAPEAIGANANLRGSVRIAAGGRNFEYSDGTPVFILADTLWAANTARAGLGHNEDGPFFRYLADRQAKGFNTVLMSYFHGYGDYPDAPGHRNEGGHTYFDRDVTRLNPAHFAALDRRMEALWRRGFVAAIPATWWAKTRVRLFTPEDARRMSAYCAVRYGAFNALWSLSGEYQYALRELGWTPADFTALGEAVQQHNPWRRPLSIHPSGQITWPAPHDVQSSRPFHGESWLDHHWLQTGQRRDRLFNIVTRLRDDRALLPAVPVFLSEAFYEGVNDPESAYHARWQVWAALLNGAAGYGYGAHGIWQFYDPEDPQGEPGKVANSPVPWSQALAFPGSRQILPLRKFLAELPWWQLEPERARVQVDGGPNPLPTPGDISPVHAAFVGTSHAVLYLPRGNAERTLALQFVSAAPRTARWFDPRTGRFTGASVPVPATDNWILPRPPISAEEDWVLIVSAH